MSNATPNGVSYNRRPSRSNSTSSSMVTVRKTPSLSSRSTSRGPFAKPRSASPEQVGFQLTAILTSNPARPRSASRSSRPSSVADGKGQNINRWSHSTSSSISGLEEASKKRKSNSSRRLSIGPIHTSNFLSNSNKARTPPAAEKTSRPRRVSQAAAPPSQAPVGPPPKPPLNTTTLPKAAYRPSSRTPSTATATPGTAEILSLPSYGGVRASDYFGDEWHSRGPILPGIGVGAAEPMSGFNSAASPPKRPHQSENARSPEAIRSSGRPRGHESEDRNRRPGHSRGAPQRNGDRSANESIDTAAGSSMSSNRSDRSRNRGHRSPTQKTMLSKALAKANTAVLLDNAQNFEGAVDAYVEACELLRQVMLRSSDDEDRTKLSTIRSTYSSRISELREIEDAGPAVNTEKALPRRPGSMDATQSSSAPYLAAEVPPTIKEPTLETRDSAFPPRRQSLMPPAFMNSSSSSLDKLSTEPEEPQKPEEPDIIENGREAPIRLGLQPPRSRYAPPPLSPRRPPPDFGEHVKQEYRPPQEAAPEPPKSPKHARDPSTESTSWLDTIDESASSASSSRFSSLDIRPNFGSNLIDEIEAEFDAALSAAVDAAYHEGSRPGTTDPGLPEVDVGTPVTAVHRDTPAAHSPAIPPQEDVPSLSRSIESSMQESNSVTQRDSNQESQFYDDDAEEEERLLEEMTQGYGFGDFHFDKQSKSALPRQSDSSGFSGRTWPSSNGSTSATNGTSLSTLAEIMEAPSIDQKTLPPRPMPTAALPAPPIPTNEPPPPPPVSAPVVPPAAPSVSRSMSTSTEPGRPSFEKPTGPGVRDRRLSGQNAKQLKIETHSRSRRSSVSQPAGKMQAASLPKIEAPPATEPLPVMSSSELALEPLLGPPSLGALVMHPLTPIASIHSASSLHSGSPSTPALTHGESQISVDETTVAPSSPGQFVDAGKSRIPSSMLRKNTSQSSLKMRNLSVATIDDSPITPNSATFPAELRKTNTHAFTLSGPPIGGMYLFDDHIGTPNTPRTPGTTNANANLPAPLEPCPDSFLLRPFWLMRCLYQTIAHPRGGYLTTSLFLPREIWRVKNVKLKAIDDKIAQSDFLSAALLRLANVDQLDAEAVLEEMQAFEMVLESVRIVLQKKLGNEVGLAGSGNMFKGAPMSPDEANEAHLPKAGSAAKFASSWRKLRSKSSAAQLNPHPHPGLALKDGKGIDATFTLPTLPMTSSVGVQSSRTQQARRNPANLKLSSLGANANYMASLAKLFDAAQILDTIARQVEDPGLKCSSKTHVGLELCVRNASEFFAFFVVRWVVADVGSLVDKFVKRGGEWVMS